MNVSRPALLVGGLALVGGLGPRVAAAARPVLTVYKSPDCSCCELWINHVKAHGFGVEPKDVSDLAPIKTEYQVPRDLGSCHTALVDGYVVEGHVPADLIDRLLAERLAIAGIAVPGMPIGSPGMEVRGQPAQRYRVLTFDRDGRTTIFATR